MQSEPFFSFLFAKKNNVLAIIHPEFVDAHTHIATEVFYSEGTTLDAFLEAQQILLNSQNRGLYNNQGNTLEQWQENLKAVDLRADSSTKKPISPPIRPQDIEIIERSFQSPKYRKKAR